MEENNNQGQENNKIKQFIKDEAKNAGKKLAKTVIKFAWQPILIFFVILLAVGFINAVQNSIIDWFTSLFSSSEITTSNGVYDNSIIGAAQQVHDEEKDWVYFTEHEKGLDSLKSPVQLALTNSDKSTCCATYVGCVLYASGYFSSEEIGNNFHQPHILNQMLANYGWEKITNKDEFQAGDIVFCDKDNEPNGIDHVQIYAGDNKWYNAGNTYDIQHSAPKQGNDNWDSGYAECWAYRAVSGPRYEAPTRKKITDFDGSIIVLDENGKYKLIVDDLSEQILKKLEEQKVNNKLNGFVADDDAEEISESELQDMIDKYIKVEANTGLPQITNWIDRLFNIDGMIKIQRVSGETGETKLLTYKKLSDFEKNPDLDSFSLTQDFELCIARPGSYTIHYDENDNIIGSQYDEGGTIVIEKIPYKDYIKNYIVPFNFLISLHVIAQDKDFMDDVVDMILDKDNIILTYVETKHEQIEKIEYVGETKKSKKDVEKEEEEKKEETGKKEEKEEIEEKNNKVKIKKINNSNVKAETAKTPAVEISEYFKKVEKTYSGELYVTKADTWLVISEKKIDSKSSGQSNTSSEEVFSQQNVFEYIYTTEEKNIFGIKNTYDVSQWLMRNITTEYQNVENTVVDGNFALNVEDFINLIESYPDVKNRISSAPSNLFYMLQQHENTLFLEKFMRYVLFRLNDVDYGITEEDLLFLFSDSFNKVEIVGNISSYIKQFAYKYRTETNNAYYMLHKDKDGELIIGSINLPWKDYSSYFKRDGKIKHNGEEKSVENIAEYVDNEISNSKENLNIYIEKELVDDICKRILETIYKELVDNDLFALQLSRQQTYALAAIKYDFGYLPVVDGKTFKQVYRKGMQQFEEGSWQHNKYIWDNWWALLGDGSKVIARDAQYETYLKGTFDFSLSDAGNVFSRTKYIYYTKEQLEIFDDAHNIPVTRTPENEEKIFTLEQRAGTFERVNEKYITGYYTSTTGRRFTILCQSKIGYENRDYWRLNDPPDGPGWAGRCNRAAAAIIASGYSDEDANSLITTMNKYYDDIIPSNKYWSLYGLKCGPYKGEMSVASYTEELRKQLQSGGYACIWLNKGEYYGKSGEPWTTGIHWVAVLDYKIENGKEKIAIADHRGVKWYDIDEFGRGISNYCNISEK